MQVKRPAKRFFSGRISIGLPITVLVWPCRCAESPPTLIAGAEQRWFSGQSIRAVAARQYLAETVAVLRRNMPGAGTMTPEATVAAPVRDPRPRRSGHFHRLAHGGRTRSPTLLLGHAAQGRDSASLYGNPGRQLEDNIDVKGLPTTAACPAFAYRPSARCTAVSRVCARSAPSSSARSQSSTSSRPASSAPRSPYGVPRCAGRREASTPGGSRAPARPSRSPAASLVAARARHRYGRLRCRFRAMLCSTSSSNLQAEPQAGVDLTVFKMACRTLDCVSVFALTTDDGWAA